MGASYIGSRVERREDFALLTGRGRYTDDIELPNTVVAVFLRAQMAHALIKGVDVSAALALPGVHGVWTLADLPESLRRATPLQVPNAVMAQPRTFHVLAGDEVRYVGEPVAVVLADSRAIGEDAIDRIVVDYDPLPVVSDLRRAAAKGSPVAHRGAADNVVADVRLKFGDADAAFARAPIRVTESFFQHRGGCHAMEGRAVLAQYEPISGQLTVWSATQAPHMVKNMLVEMLGHDDARIRVVAPDVGVASARRRWSIRRRPSFRRSRS
jgi:carbon-monoxide dehydrogenase large subunit